MNRYSFLDGKLCITSVTKMRKTLEGIERILVPKRGFKPQRPIEHIDGHTNRQIVTNSFDEDEGIYTYLVYNLNMIMFRIS